MMDDKQAKLVETLAELVAWYGEETSGDYSRRIISAERLLKRVAPTALRIQRNKVKTANQ